MITLDQLLEDFYSEDIEKHQELNPKLFEGEKLKQEVLEKINEIVDQFKQYLEDAEIPAMEISDIILVGSNVSYNYTKDSDLDIHIKVNLAQYSSEEVKDLLEKLYSAQKSIFNKNLSISFYDIPVEIYVEVEGVSKLNSNGIYSVVKNDWIKKPDLEAIPDLSDEFKNEVENAVQPYEDRYNDIKKNPSIEAIDKIIEDIYDERAKGMEEGEYSLENLVFKEFRNRGYLDELKELRHEVTSDELSLSEADLSEYEYPIDESITYDYLNEYLENDQLNTYRVKIAQMAQQQPKIDQNGNFKLYNIKENDLMNVLARLRTLEFIDQKQLDYVAGKFDFSHPMPGKPQPRYYDIHGKVKE